MKHENGSAGLKNWLKSANPLGRHLTPWTVERSGGWPETFSQLCLVGRLRPSGETSVTFALGKTLQTTWNIFTRDACLLLRQTRHITCCLSVNDSRGRVTSVLTLPSCLKVEQEMCFFCRQQIWTQKGKLLGLHSCYHQSRNTTLINESFFCVCVRVCLRSLWIL